MFAMNALTVIATDLLTPLGAYLRLREGGRASFLLESVEQGRLGRHSFVGCGSRLVYLRRGGGAAAQPVVGYLGYDHVAKLEPTVPLPDDGPRPAREPLRRRRRRSSASTTAAGWPRCSAATPTRSRALLEGRSRRRRRPRGAARGSTRRLPPAQAEYERGVARAKEHIRAGDAFQIVLSQRAERPTSACALELYRALRRVNPSPYLFLLELDGLALVGSSPETLVKCEGRRASAEPDRGHDAAAATATPSGCSPPRRTAPST